MGPPGPGAWIGYLTPMEALGTCADNLAEYWALLLPSLIFIVTMIVFAFRRTLTSLLFGLFWGVLSYILGLIFIPHLVVLFVMSTMGIGFGICSGQY